MNIGDKVEFENIVGRKYTTQFVMEPVKIPIGKQKGVIVGLTRVYKSDTGDVPPFLFDHQEVYLVATSMWKRVKVFKEDIVSDDNGANAPTPIGIGAPAGTPAVVLNPVIVAMIEELVDQAVEDGDEFTAYTITQRARAKLPNSNVNHQPTRDIVHSKMLAYIANGQYDVEARDFNGNTALTYFPL